MSLQETFKEKLGKGAHPPSDSSSIIRDTFSDINWGEQPSSQTGTLDEPHRVLLSARQTVEGAADGALWVGDGSWLAPALAVVQEHDGMQPLPSSQPQEDFAAAWAARYAQHAATSIALNEAQGRTHGQGLTPEAAKAAFTASTAIRRPLLRYYEMVAKGPREAPSSRFVSQLRKSLGESLPDTIGNPITVFAQRMRRTIISRHSGRSRP